MTTNVKVVMKLGINEYIQVGSRIKNIRKSQRLTQREVAKRLGMAFSTYSNYENNNREPSFETLKNIADVLGVSIARLLGGDTAELAKAGKFIEREKVLEMFREWEQECVKGDDRELFDIVRDKHVEINDIPVVDVRAERHGWWSPNALETADYLAAWLECSLCGYRLDDDDYKDAFRYCPNCGAKMDGKDEKTMMVQTIDDATRMKRFDDAVGWWVIPEFKEWLIANGFFVKPAAINHHGNYSGGLFDHSFEVMTALIEMTKRFDIHWQDERSPYIVGMFHDLCKVDDYIDENAADIVIMGTGSPISANPKWGYNKSTILKGHGNKSVMMLAQFLSLTEEEIYCILFHMGAYETDRWNEFDAAIRKYQTVLWTHTADMYASKVMGI